MARTMPPKTMTQDTWFNMDGKRYCIPKGYTIKARYEYMNKFGLNEDWNFKSKEDGMKMDLSNWLNDDNKFVMNKSFTSFGIGRRDCAGRQLAEKQIQIIMGYIIMNYKLSLQDKDIDTVDKSLCDTKGDMNAPMNKVDPPIDVRITPIVV